MAETIKAYYAQAMKDDPNVLAVGRGLDGGVKVLVRDDRSEKVARYARRGQEVEYIRSQGFYAYQIPTKRFRPAPGGVSCGSHRITAGTMSGVVRDARDGSIGIISDNHVFCPYLDGPRGEPIVQPGAMHGGRDPQDTIAHLERWHPLKTGTPTIDAAYARAVNQELEKDISLNVLNIGYVYGIEEPFPGQFLYKMGARTDLSKGWCTLVDVRAKVDYGTREITLDDLFVSTVFSGPGDSGSWTLDFAANTAVGMLFAGDGMVSLHCKMSNIAQLLEVEIIEPPEIKRSKVLDISHWSGEIDVSRMQAHHVRGLMMKVSQRLEFRDARFHQYYDIATAAGMLRGGYIYVDPEHNAQEHFDNFMAHLGGRELEMPVALDCEEKYGDQRHITSVIQNLSQLLSAQFGRRPMIYTSPGFWNANVLPWTEWQAHPLWVANWTQFGLTPLLPYSWTDLSQVAMWQFFVNENAGELGVLGNPRVDINRTYRLFEKVITGGSPPVSLSASASPSPSPSEPPPPDEKKTGVHHFGRTLKNDQNYRKVPTTLGNTPLGKMPKGTVVEIIAEVQDAAGNTWARIGYKEYAAIVHNKIQYIEYVMNE